MYTIVCAECAARSPQYPTFPRCCEAAEMAGWVRGVLTLCPVCASNPSEGATTCKK